MDSFRVLVIIIIISPWQPSQANTCDSEYSQSGHVLLDHVVQSLMVTSSDDCVHECSTNSTCNSINFYEDKNLCEINNATHLSSPEDLVSANRHAIYMMFSRRPLVVCSNQFCSDPDICFMNSDGSTFRCQSKCV
jgi:hypothetical protein